MAIGLVVVAQLVDRFAARYILVPGFVLFAVSMALIGLVPPIEWVYLIPCFFVGFFGAGTAVPAAGTGVTGFGTGPPRSRWHLRGRQRPRHR
ncbi:hypothetical protein PWG71_19200 [Nocardiopsis sp. N85]|uniref:hypothetical protein n=1 Tax=Nocardiopsis sp. N85 TaxID=3029400 RepID=UPI00237F95EC|nr:hypothetical protein [Nocardiopsis sp. N85]MDE3723522.1 hypothetical protein [Nocardiopsis sp. N85]